MQLGFAKSCPKKYAHIAMIMMRSIVLWGVGMVERVYWGYMRKYTPYTDQLSQISNDINEYKFGQF